MRSTNQKLMTNRPVERDVSKLFDVSDLAQMFNVSVKTIRRLIGERRIGYHRIKAKILVSQEQINEFLMMTEIHPFDAAKFAEDFLERKR